MVQGLSLSPRASSKTHSAFENLLEILPQRDPPNPQPRALTSETGNENTSRQLDPKRHYGQRGLHHQRHRNRSNDRQGLLRRVEDAQSGVGVAGTAFGEEVVHELGAAHARVGVDEAEDGGREGYLDARCVRCGRRREGEGSVRGRLRRQDAS